MRRLPASFALPILMVLALSACGSGHPSNESSAIPAGEQVHPSAAADQSQASASAEQGRPLHAQLVLVDGPRVTADGMSVAVTVKITNDGSDAFGSASDPHKVNLGAHAVEAHGKIIVNDLSRAPLPQIDAGTSD